MHHAYLRAVGVAVGAAALAYGGVLAAAAHPAHQPVAHQPATHRPATHERAVPPTAAAAPAAGSYPAASGRFTNAAGAPLAGLTVDVRLAGVAAPVGRSYSAPAVGRTRTAADGSWVLRLPAPLPTPLRAAAAANGGVLDLVAHVLGTAPDGTAMLGSAYLPVSTAVGPPAARIAALGLRATHPSVAVYPVKRSVSLARTGVMTAPAVSQPAMVNGVNYARVVPADNPCHALPTMVLRSTIAYTTVGETHAYRDALASFTYQDTMSTYLSAVADFGAGPVTLAGGSFLAGSGGIGVGIAPNAAPFGRQFQVPIRYNEVRYGSSCLHGGPFYSSGVEAIGYSAPPGGATSLLGRDVRSADGPVAYAHSPRGHQLVVPSNTSVSISYSRFITYTAAASVFGLGIRATTAYDQNHSQTLTAGHQHFLHHVWGARDGFGRNADGSMKDPGVMYSY